MDIIKIQITGTRIHPIQCPGYITSGTVGLPVEFSFDSRWDGLTKLAVFSAGVVSRTVSLTQNSTVVPWEVLQEQGCWLRIGVYGVNADGTLAIPTLYADVCVILPGADPDADPSVAPTNPIWQETAARLETLEQTIGPKTIVDTYNPYDHYEMFLMKFEVFDFYWHKYLDGTAEIYVMGQLPSECSTETNTTLDIKLPFCLYNPECTINNYVTQKGSSVYVYPKQEYIGADYAWEQFYVDIYAKFLAADYLPNNIVDFDIRITGRWK